MTTSELVDQAVIKVIQKLSEESELRNDSIELISLYTGKASVFTNKIDELDSLLNQILQEQFVHGYYVFLKLKEIDEKTILDLTKLKSYAEIKEQSSRLLNQATNDLFELFSTPENKSILSELVSNLNVPSIMIKQFIVICGSLGFYQAVNDYLTEEKEMEILTRTTIEGLLEGSLLFISPIHNIKVNSSSEGFKWIDIYYWSALQSDTKIGELIIDTKNKQIGFQCHNSLDKIEREFLLSCITDIAKMVLDTDDYTIRLNIVSDYYILE